MLGCRNLAFRGGQMGMTSTWEGDSLVLLSSIVIVCSLVLSSMCLCVYIQYMHTFMYTYTYIQYIFTVYIYTILVCSLKRGIQTDILGLFVCVVCVCSLCVMLLCEALVSWQ